MAIIQPKMAWYNETMYSPAEKAILDQVGLTGGNGMTTNFTYQGRNYSVDRKSGEYNPDAILRTIRAEQSAPTAQPVSNFTTPATLQFVRNPDGGYGPPKGLTPIEGAVDGQYADQYKDSQGRIFQIGGTPFQRNNYATTLTQVSGAQLSNTDDLFKYTSQGNIYGERNLPDLGKVQQVGETPWMTLNRLGYVKSTPMQYGSYLPPDVAKTVEANPALAGQPLINTGAGYQTQTSAEMTPNAPGQGFSTIQTNVNQAAADVARLQEQIAPKIDYSPMKSGETSEQYFARIGATAPVAPTGQTHTVKSGDTLSAIAKQYGVGINDISGYKSGNPNLIYPGENLSIGGAKGQLPGSIPSATGATPTGVPSPSNALAPLTAEQTAKIQGLLNKPQETPISSPIASPSPQTTSISPPTFKEPEAFTTTSTYLGSVSSGVNSVRTTLENSYKTQIEDYKKQIEDLNKKQQDLQVLMGNNMLTAGDAVTKETTEKREALDLEKQRVNENYNANQTLVNELDGLLTAGNQIIEQMRNTTGLASIMNPRIAKTMTDVTARAGVIQAVLSARNNQIGVAQSQLNSSLNAISSIYNDQLNYYKTLGDYYQNQKDDRGKKLIQLTSDQKAYMNAQEKLLETDLQRLQDSKTMIEKAMTDPDTALAFAQSGVTLNDTPQQINAKLGNYAYAKEVANQSNKMALDGVSYLLPGQSVPAGSQAFTTTDSRGAQKTWYKPLTKSQTPSSPTTTKVDLLTLDERKKQYPDLPLSLVGTPERQILNDLESMSAPKWFTDLQPLVFSPQGLQDAWNDFRQKVKKIASGRKNTGSDEWPENPY